MPLGPTQKDQKDWEQGEQGQKTLQGGCLYGIHIAQTISRIL